METWRRSRQAGRPHGVLPVAARAGWRRPLVLPCFVAVAVTALLAGCGTSARQAPAGGISGSSPKAAAASGKVPGISGATGLTGGSGRSRTAGTRGADGKAVPRGRAGTSAGGATAPRGGAGATGRGPSSGGGSRTGPATGAARYAAYYKPNGAALLTPTQPTTITATDYAFRPNTLTVKAGTTATLRLDNAATEPHNFDLPSLGVDLNLPAGRTVVVTLAFQKPGTFYFYCNLPGHATAGMVGKILVR